MYFKYSTRSLVSLSLIIWNCISAASAQSGNSQVNNVIAISGGMILLNCTLPNHVGPVLWLRPGDSSPVSRNYEVLSPLNKLARVLGDPTKGEYHLLLRYTQHPLDAGTWTCTSDDVSVKVNLLLLVPPAVKMPSVTPKEITEIGDLDEKAVYTISCSGHYAFPPVQLTWVKETGPDAIYDVTPPSVVVTRSQTMSMSIKLILTPANAGSRFACLATHPLFMGQVFSTSFNFLLPDDAVAQAQVLPNNPSTVDSRHKQVIYTSLDSNDKALILLFLIFSSLCFLCIMLLNKFRNRWDWNVPVQKVDQNLNTKPLCDTSEEVEIKGDLRNKRRNFVCRTIVMIVAVLLLLISLLFSFPVYFKSLTIPIVPNADEITSVFAGSALWLDCRQLVQPITSVVQVTWYHNAERFYNQYYLNGQNIGYPNNSTKGFMLGIRVSSIAVGQITIWPVAPGEEGLYSCQVVMSTDDDGVTAQRQQTTAVFVLTGPMVNWALIILLVAALVFTLIISVLLFYNSLIRQRIVKQEKRDIEDDS